MNLMYMMCIYMSRRGRVIGASYRLRIQSPKCKTARFFILTGSQQFELLEGISQSLAGRTALINLLPFTLEEAYGEKDIDISLDKVLLTGFYPRIFDKNLNPTEAMLFYVNTYVERDLRMLINGRRRKIIIKKNANIVL